MAGSAGVRSRSSWPYARRRWSRAPARAARDLERPVGHSQLPHARKLSRAGRRRIALHGSLRRRLAGDGHRPVRTTGTAADSPAGSRTAARRVQLDPERLGHEPPARLDPRPGVRVGRRERRRAALVGERDAVLDVRREVGGAGRRDDVAPGTPCRTASSIVEPGEDRRVDPLVEVDLVAGVEEDAEERVAEVAVDDRLQRAAGLADVQRPVPLGDRREVRRRRAVDVVADRRRAARRRPRPRSRRGSSARPRCRTRS